MSKLPIGQRLIMAAFACLIDSAFTYGFNVVVIHYMKVPVTNWLKKMHSNVEDRTIATSAGILGYTVNPPLIRLLHSFIFIGSSVGGLLSIHFAKKLGRKGGMLMTSFISAFAALFAGYSKFFENSLLLFIGCFFIGIKIGINSALGPLYLMEISPKQIRVRVTAIFSLFVTTGVVTSFYVSKYIGNKDYWPLVLSLNVIPAVIQLLILPSCPESPKYLLVIKGKELEAKNALKWLRGDKYNEEEIYELRAELYQRRALGVITLKEIVNNDVLLHALLISTIIIVSNRLCGYATVYDYGNQLIRNYISTDYALHSFHLTLIIFATIPTYVIEKYQRKTLLAVTYLIMSMMCLIMFLTLLLPSFNYSFIIFITSTIFMAAYEMGVGCVMWFISSEHFSTSAAPIANGIGFASSALTNACVILYYIPFQNLLGSHNLLNFTISNAILAYFVHTKVAETRNRTLKEIYNDIYIIKTGIKT